MTVPLNANSNAISGNLRKIAPENFQIENQMKKVTLSTKDQNNVLNCCTSVFSVTFEQVPSSKKLVPEIADVY